MNANANQKIVTLSFILVGGLTALVTKVIFTTLATHIAFFSKFYTQDIFQHGVPMVAGLIAFSFLQLNRGICFWANEVVMEIKNIVWPSRKDTIAMTVVCCIMLIVAGIVLGIFDFFASHFMKLILE